MLQTNFSRAIFFFQGRCLMSRNRIIHRLRTSMLDTLEIALLQPHGILIWIIDLHFMAKWRSPSFKYRRGFDQLRTPQRCSYFQFVSFRFVYQITLSPKNSGDMVDSSFTIETKCILWHQIFERQTQRRVLQTLTLWLSCIQFCV